MRKKKKNRGNDDESNLQTTVTYYGGSVIRRFELNLDLNHAQVAVTILPLFEDVIKASISPCTSNASLPET